MLYTLNNLEGFTINATDGHIGKVKDFYFDDRVWIIRYLVVETGAWLKSRKVLVPITSIKCVHLESKVLTLDASLYQVKNGPSIERSLSVSAQTEIDYLSYYGYSFHRGATNLHANPQCQNRVEDEKVNETFAAIDTVRRTYGDRHLRSCKEMIGYNIEATDSEVGCLQGMLFDEDNWCVKYLMVNTSHWWLGHQVVLETQVIKDISWGDAKIYVNLLRQQVQEAPIFEPDALDAYEKHLGAHLYQRRKNTREKKSFAKHI